MSRNALIESIEKEHLQKKEKKNIDSFSIGDTIRIHSKIIEGEKERIQALTGIVIARKGSGISETFSIYRIAHGTAMERVYMLNSPRIEKLEVIRKGKVRRSKLYFLRGTQGKAAKVKEQIFKKKK